jgi:glycosyltransferase involved in cell wall biosynthesis
LSGVTAPLRVAIVPDYREEGWPSMDIVADMLLRHLRADHAAEVRATRIEPPFRWRFDRERRGAGRGFTLDRMTNRLVDYPRHLRSRLGEFDLFHVVDHSYGQLLHTLPRERTIVTCHDLDTFRSVLEPERERRSPLFRAMTRRVLTGFQRAALVTCDSAATRDALLAHQVLPAERLVVLPLGVDPLFTADADPAADARVQQWLGPPDARCADLLHVGSTIPRKRIDVLLRVLAAVRETVPAARLLRVGGALTAEQEALARSLGVLGAVVTLPFLDTAALAAVYRRSALVLLPSQAEGFGFPVVEALRCGVPVVASDLPVLREVGGDVAVYCPVADVARWSTTVAGLLRERAEDPRGWEGRRQRGIEQASSFSWAAFAARMVVLYRKVLAS